MNLTPHHQVECDRDYIANLEIKLQLANRVIAELEEELSVASRRFNSIALSVNDIYRYLEDIIEDTKDIIE